MLRHVCGAFARREQVRNERGGDDTEQHQVAEHGVQDDEGPFGAVVEGRREVPRAFAYVWRYCSIITMKAVSARSRASTALTPTTPMDTTTDKTKMPT